jgi:hypothetical protein
MTKKLNSPWFHPQDHKVERPSKCKRSKYRQLIQEQLRGYSFATNQPNLDRSHHLNLEHPILYKVAKGFYDVFTRQGFVINLPQDL